MDSYTTVKNDASEEMIERKSRFIGHCRSVKTQEEAMNFIEEIRSMQKQATHNVYAYVLRNENISRYSDDGEPSGTAGVPVLEVIKKEGLTDVVVVVTRYFGGILLGAGGLVRAYGKSAALAIERAQKTEMVYSSIYLVRCDYSTYGKIEYLINDRGYILRDSSFENDVCLTVCVPENESDKFVKSVNDISGGTAKVVLVSGEYVPT